MGQRTDERSKPNPREYLKTCPHSSSGGQVGESVQDSLSKLGAEVQQLFSAVTDLQARSDLQVEVHAARPTKSSTPVSRRPVEEHDEMLTPTIPFLEDSWAVPDWSSAPRRNVPARGGLYTSDYYYYINFHYAHIFK